MAARLATRSARKRERRRLVARFRRQVVAQQGAGRDVEHLLVIRDKPLDLGAFARSGEPEHAHVRVRVNYALAEATAARGAHVFAGVLSREAAVSAQ